MVEGKAAFEAAGRVWGVLGERMSVFEKSPPHCLYLPNGSEWSATAETDCVNAVCSAPGKGEREGRLIGPESIRLTQRGGGANNRNLTNIARGRPEESREGHGGVVKGRTRGEA